MAIDEELAENVLNQRNAEFENVREVGEETRLSTDHVALPKAKPKVETPQAMPTVSPEPQPMPSQPAARSLHSEFDIGWYEVPLNILPSQGLFYPEGSRLMIKAAPVSVIRHFSTVDETNTQELNSALDYILQHLVRFSVPGMVQSYKNLKDIDRIAVILHVRDVTFKNGESKIVSEIRCKCGNVDEKTLHWDDFVFFEPNDELMRWYNNEHRIFVVSFNDPTINSIGLTLPSIGTRDFVQSYVTERIRTNRPYDKAFANIAPHLLQDWTTLNSTVYEHALEESGSWNIQQFAGFVRVIDLIKKARQSKIKHKCTKCGAEVTAPSSFRGGIKSLFISDLQSITR